jgi:hypothetical protein
MKVKVIKSQGNIKPGIWDLSSKFANKLLKEGKAVEVKEEKRSIETKEEKFHQYKLTKQPLSKLNIETLSSEDLKYIIENDSRKTAVIHAKQELAKR